MRFGTFRKCCEAKLLVDNVARYAFPVNLGSVGTMTIVEKLYATHLPSIRAAVMPLVEENTAIMVNTMLNIFGLIDRNLTSFDYVTKDFLFTGSRYLPGYWSARELDVVRRFCPFIFQPEPAAVWTARPFPFFARELRVRNVTEGVEFDALDHRASAIPKLKGLLVKRPLLVAQSPDDSSDDEEADEVDDQLVANVDRAYTHTEQVMRAPRRWCLTWGDVIVGIARVRPCKSSSRIVLDAMRWRIERGVGSLDVSFARVRDILFND